MPAQIKWSQEAVTDLADIRRYIARDSERYAQSVVEKIVTSTRMLETFPLIGRHVPESKREVYRELIVYQYRVIYRVEGDGSLFIVAIIHGARLLPDNRLP